MYWHIICAAVLVGRALSDQSAAPCGLITAQAQHYLNDPANTDYFYFDTELGNACLESSTIDNDLAVSFIQEYKKYIQFQSTLSYLKDPPPDYPYPSVDIVGGLDRIATTAATGGYSSQYAFDKAIYQLITSAHEGHLYTTLCTSQAIQYFRSVDFISLSSDGIQLPLVYTLDDAEAYTDNLPVSNIVAINGQDVTNFIENEALSIFGDPDAHYNFMFWGVGRAPYAGNSTGFLTALPPYSYPGAHTNLTFANGTHKSYPNQAATSQYTWSNKIVDGESFTHKLCIEPAQTNGSSASTTSSAVSNLPTMIGHPEKPIVKDPNNSVAGYFLNGTEYNDTAVLYVSSFYIGFNGNSSDYTDTFVNTTRDFLAAAKAADKTKLVIDLSGNPGGNLLLAYDLFRRLFPDIEPDGTGRFRVPIAGDIYGQALGKLSQEQVDPQASDSAVVALNKSYWEGAPWNYRTSLSTNLTNLTSWADFFPPNEVNGDYFTTNVRFPTNNTYWDLQGGFIPYGSAGLPEDPQPFPAENIVILTDGGCGSACSSFTTFMTHQAGVQTIVVGGRPQDAPMQAVGGTKGSLVFTFDSFQKYSQLLFENGMVPDSLLEVANNTFPGLINLPLGDPDNLAGYAVNLRDSISLGDDTQTPLQFIFEPADCRIFYTPVTASEPHKLWEYAADVAWKGKECAWGGMSSIANPIADEYYSEGTTSRR